MVFHVLVLLCTATIRQGQKAFASFPCSSVQVSEGCSCQVRWATQLQAHHTTEFLSLCIQLLGQAEKGENKVLEKKSTAAATVKVSRSAFLYGFNYTKKGQPTLELHLFIHRRTREICIVEKKKRALILGSASCLYWDLLHSLSNASYIYWKA